jgi:hypothetical protein
VGFSGLSRIAGPRGPSPRPPGRVALNMLVPVLLAIGGAVTLALRALPPAGRDAPPGPREWLAGLVASRLARAMTHPLLALVLFVGSFYVRRGRPRSNSIRTRAELPITADALP